MTKTTSESDGAAGDEPLFGLAPESKPLLQPETATVASLARQLHVQDGERLEFSLAQGQQLDLLGFDGVTVVDGVLRFATLADRNRILAADTLAALGDQALDPAELFAAARRLWRHEIGHDDTASGRLLALIHPRSDVLAMAAGQISGGRDVFNVLNLVQKTLPHLSALDWQSLIALTRTQFPRTKGDGAAGWFFSHVRLWLIERPGSGAQLTNLLLESPSEELANLLLVAWLAWATDDAAQAAARLDALQDQADASLPGVTAQVAGRMLLDANLAAQVAAPLVTLLQRRLVKPTREERHGGLVAATDLLPVRRDFDERLRELAQKGDEDTLGYLAFVLGRQAGELIEAGLFFEWLALCTALPASHINAIGSLDSALSLQLRTEAPHQDAVLAFLQDWISTQALQDARVGQEFGTLFSSCAGRMLGDPALLARVLTTWFLAESRALPEAAAQLISGLGNEARPHRGHTPMPAVRFDSDLLGEIPPQDFLFLARRLIGYVIDSQLLLSLALSLLRVKDAKQRVHPLMDSLLGEEIGLDYPGTTVKRLQGAIDVEQDADTKSLLERIRAKLQAYLDELNALPRLRELAVSPALQHAFLKARSKQMEEGIREGQRESVLLQLVTQVHLKAGRRSFQYLHDDFTQPMELKAMSYSFELPRRESTDPVGNAYRSHLNRSAKRGGT